MNKYFRKNGKKIMAVLGILLMIAFALPSATSSMRRSEGALGTIDHGRVTITSHDYNHYRNQWLSLKQHFGLPVLALALSGIDRIDEELLIRTLGDPQVAEDLAEAEAMRRQNPMSFFQRMQFDQAFAFRVQAMNAGMPIVTQIDNNDDLFVLLASEADAMGVGVNGDAIEEILQRRHVSKDDDPDMYNALRVELRTLLTVSNAAARAAGVVKVSRPEVEHALASQRQRVAANVVEFAAADFLDKVPAPTPDQLKAQFGKYKDKLAGEGKLDFGYKYPNRVKFDAVTIKHDDLKKGVAPVELDEAWEYFLRNKNSHEFVKDVPAGTQPADAFTLDRGATTRPMTFDEAREKIVTKLSGQRADQLAEKIRDAVRNTMKADYDAFKVATASGPTATTTATTTAASAAPPSSLGVPYNTFEYLKKLRDKIQSDFKVTVTIQDQQAWQTPKALEESELGKGSYTNDASTNLPAYLSEFVNNFLTPDQLKQAAIARPDRRPVAVWEPTPAFHNFGDDYVIARVTAADPSHVAASLDEVKDQVAADVRLNAAFDKAKQAAQAAADAAKSKWLATVAGEQKKKVITTELFTVDAVRSGVVPGYDLKSDAVEAFVQGTFKLLAGAQRTGEAPKPATTQPAATTQASAAASKPAATTRPTSAPVVTAFKDHPVGVIELPADAKVVVAEIDQLKPAWNKEQVAGWMTSLANQERITVEQQIRIAWFNYDQVVTRTTYQPKEKRERKPPTPQVPINPF